MTRKVRKQFGILLICLLSILSVSAQKKISRITLEVENGNLENTMPVNNFSYDFNKYDEDTAYDSTTKAVTVMVSCKLIPAFIYEAASKSMSHSVSVILTCYGENGDKQKVLKMPQAVIDDLSESYAQQNAEMSDKSIVIRSHILIIDNVRL